MKVNSLEIEIDNFDNDAMVEDRTGEVCRILRELASQIEEYGVPHVDGCYLKDINGNTVGNVSVDWEEDEDGDESLSMSDFIEQNREEIVSAIRNVLDHVPATASCDCPKSGTDHFHNDSGDLDDDDIEQWIMNDEGLYNWARREGVDV